MSTNINNLSPLPFRVFYWHSPCWCLPGFSYCLTTPIFPSTRVYGYKPQKTGVGVYNCKSQNSPCQRFIAIVEANCHPAYCHLGGLLPSFSTTFLPFQLTGYIVTFHDLFMRDGCLLVVAGSDYYSPASRLLVLANICWLVTYPPFFYKFGFPRQPVSYRLSVTLYFYLLEVLETSIWITWNISKFTETYHTITWNPPSGKGGVAIQV